MFSNELIVLATDTLAKARAKGVKIATAESCTGGLIAGLLTEIAGSSDVFERGFVTYSNDAKTELLGVPASEIRAHGAVSGDVAMMMARGALQRSKAHIAVAVTGIAGPGGGTPQKPVGLVYLAVTSKANIEDMASDVMEARFGDLGRTEIRLKTVEAALRLLETRL